MNKYLIVVDMQYGFLSKEKTNYINLIQKINSLINKNIYDKIIFTKFKNQKNSFYETKLKWKKLQTKKEQRICVNIPKNSIILEKNGYGLSKEQIDFLCSLGLNEIDICGIQTDACVYAIALQLFDNGIYPNILINYCETDPAKNNYAKQMLIHQFGKVCEDL